MPWMDLLFALACLVGLFLAVMIVSVILAIKSYTKTSRQLDSHFESMRKGGHL